MKHFITTIVIIVYNCFAPIYKIITQARKLLHPDYFLKEESSIKIVMLLWQDEKKIVELQEKLNFFIV